MGSAVDQSLVEVAPSLGATGPLALRRAWPRGGDLTLEYESTEGEVVAAQWSAQADRLTAVARKTDRRSPVRLMAVLEVGGGALLIQKGGADRRLPGLAATLARPQTTLISHRAERRATVRLEGLAQPRYRKFVPSVRLAGMVAAAEHASALSNARLATPELLEVDEPAGAATFSALDGSPLHELLARGEGDEAAIPAGEALHALHGFPPPDGLPHHTARDEIEVLLTWVGRLEAHAPSLAARVAERATETLAALSRLGTDYVPVHRDLHDKQVFVGEGGKVGLLDFDLLALGDRSLDLANLLVHFDLRGLQGHCTPAQARSASEGLLAGYEPPSEVLVRATTYAEATRLRLACVYAFRPRSSGVVERLLSRVGDGLLADSPLTVLAPTES